jgi:hypothetical protein
MLPRRGSKGEDDEEGEDDAAELQSKSFKRVIRGRKRSLQGKHGERLVSFLIIWWTGECCAVIMRGRWWS